MQANHDLETIDLALLAHINGGDAAADWRKNVNEAIDATKSRWNRAVDAFQHGEYRESLRQGGATVINSTKVVQELLEPFPFSKLIFGEHKDKPKSGKP